MVIMMVSKEKVLRKEKKEKCWKERKKGSWKEKKIKKTALFVYVSNEICKILPAFVLPAL